jgi:predicted amino acid racemase
MHYPRLEINLSKLTHNTRILATELGGMGIAVMGVNKVFNGCPETAEAMASGGMEVIAETMVDNLKKLDGLPFQKAMLRTPGLSEAADVVRYADISLTGSVESIAALSREAVLQHRQHQIMVMVDMGDLREGIWYENLDEIEEALQLVISLPNLTLYGIGTNFGCYGTILATPKNTREFADLAKDMEQRLGVVFPYISGGNGSSYYLAAKGLLPKEINHLRIGGQHIFGIEYVEGRYLEGYSHSQKDIGLYLSDAYLLKGEVIEVRNKPTVPVGVLSVDAFMQQKTFEDRGIRRTAVLNFGRQEVPWENIHPMADSLFVMGQTSNHTIVDVDDSDAPVNVGDILTFQVDYTGLMHLCNSPSVEKVLDFSAVMR